MILLAVTLVLLNANLQACVQAQPFLGIGILGSLLTPFSTEQEVQAGAQLDKTVRERYPVSTNYALQAYISSVGKRIAAQTHKNYPFTYTVLADARTANAFSGPGGFIYITTGLLNMMENEAQLAAVLGHETGHVIRHHVMKQLEERNLTQLAVGLLGQASGRNFDNSLSRLAELVLFQKFSRQDEYEADLVGTGLMTAAGYSPKGMVQILEKFNALESQGIYISFLQSHPSSISRARIIAEYIARNHLERPGQRLDSRQFHQVIR